MICVYMCFSQFGISVCHIVSCLTVRCLDFVNNSDLPTRQVMPLSARLDCMVVTTMTKRIFPLSGLGPLTKEYTLSSDFDDRWRTGAYSNGGRGGGYCLGFSQLTRAHVYIYIYSKVVWSLM